MNDGSLIGALPAATRVEMANAIRALAMDAVQKANSGHPGMPMGMADIAVALWAATYHTIRRTQRGRTGIVSCSPTGTARCCSTHCCT
jgi:transketolase N-terminal domain/subunit